MRTASSNPFDEYLGEEIIKMDLRGMAMTASDWLQLMDPRASWNGFSTIQNQESHYGFF